MITIKSIIITSNVLWLQPNTILMTLLTTKCRHTNIYKTTESY